MRKAITYLQSASRLKGDQTITKSDIYEIAGVSYLPLPMGVGGTSEGDMETRLYKRVIYTRLLG